MAKKKTNSIDGAFYALTWRMLDSPAWKELSGNDIKVFLRIARRFTRINGGKGIRLPYSEMGCSTDTIAKAIKNLERLGFINIERQGSIVNGASIYGLSVRWKVRK